MPLGSSLKKKDATVIETGRPFGPAMFEDVVKNFTPDVPSGFSGRMRSVCVIWTSFIYFRGNSL